MGREIKRVALDFDWPLNKVWDGFLAPKALIEQECAACAGSGYSPYARDIRNMWYGYVPFSPLDNGSAYLTVDSPAVRAFAERNVSRSPDYYGTGERAIVREAQRLADLFNSQMSHHLSQEDVDALVESDRLMDFTYTWTRETGRVKKDPMPEITAAQVNEWSIGGMGHDSINCMIVIQDRCERASVSYLCAVCNGHGSLEAFPGQREQIDAWEPTEPPTGEGWQVWETVSEGSPISPVLANKESLIRWLMSPAYNWGVSRPLSREQAENFVEHAWAPTGIMVGGEFINGDQYTG